jgi:hypothetical protein
VLSGVTDHYPVSEDDGGPVILANLRITHSLCNGSHGDVGAWIDGPYAAKYALTSGQQNLIAAIGKLPRDSAGHISSPDT